MADISKRFVYALNTKWYENQASNESTYNDSVVFIHNGSKKGVEIFTHGNYFKTDVALDDIKPLIDGYLSAGENITVTSKDGKLEIAAVGTNTLKGDNATSTKLVQAQAVAGALTTPLNLTLQVENGVGTFTETFTTLSGEDVEAVSAIIEAGDNITVEKGNKGLKISSNFTDTTYEAGSGLTLDGTTFKHTNKVAENTAAQENVTFADAKSFIFDQYSYDTEGHVTGKVTSTVTLPDTAFTDTTYTGSNAINIDENNQVSLKIDTADKVLSQGEAGLKANVSLSYDSDNSKILLTGVNGTELASIDTTDFVKDGMIESVAWKDGNSNILVITWNTDAGKEATEIDFAKYIDSFSHYEAGDGLQVVEDKKYAVKIKEGETFLKVDGDGLYTDGISTAITDAVSGAIGELGSTVSATVGTPSTDKVKFVTGVTIDQADGKLTSVAVEENETYTATAIDTKFNNALDWVIIA